MKTIVRSLLLFMFSSSTMVVLSQEWKWRDSVIYELKTRDINQANYTEYQFFDDADFRKSRFLVEADFVPARFDSIANFTLSKFKSTVTFHNAIFSSNADFSNVEFDSAVSFSESQFTSKTNFFDTEFTSYANFYITKFFAYVTFNRAEFSKVDFVGAQFHSNTDFSKAEFWGYANFSIAIFASKVDFSETKFNSKVNFKGTRFKSYANFSEATFKRGVDFSYSTLPVLLNFSYVSDVPIEIDLTRSKLDSVANICLISLVGAEIDSFKFRYKRFKLWFPNAESIGYEMKANVYEDLLHMQKAEGFTQSYEILNKEYKEFQYTAPDGDYSWFYGHTLNWLEKNWWGYGYDKELIIRNVFLIYLLLSLINAFILKFLTTEVYRNESIEELWNSETDVWESKWYNMMFNTYWYSLFYTAIIFFGLKFDINKLNYKGNLKGYRKLNLLYFFTIYLGGVVCLAYLANYIITV